MRWLSFPLFKVCISKVYEGVRESVFVCVRTRILSPISTFCGCWSIRIGFLQLLAHWPSAALVEKAMDCLSFLRRSSPYGKALHVYLRLQVSLRPKST